MIVKEVIEATAARMIYCATVARSLHRKVEVAAAYHKSSLRVSVARLFHFGHAARDVIRALAPTTI